MAVHQTEACTVMVFHQSPAKDLVNRARNEFHEMPGMRLSLDQAMRLWALDRDTCRDVLDQLVQTRFLDLDLNGRYKKHSGY